MFLFLCYLKINLNGKKNNICTFYWEEVLKNYINSDDIYYLG